ncbi:MAG: hypothetical protein HY901_17880 [Deltaproteobacteria bacterium]|nr:hypothetical protein [Deltaproteobacteria bacterium]
MLQFCERHMWSVLAIAVLGCAIALFTGHRATLHGKAQAAPKTSQVMAAR